MERIEILLAEMNVKTVEEGIQKLQKERFIEEGYLRFSPNNLNALDILHIVSSYGVTNDSLEEKGGIENPVGWNIHIKISRR